MLSSGFPGPMAVQWLKFRRQFDLGINNDADGGCSVRSRQIKQRAPVFILFLSFHFLLRMADNRLVDHDRQNSDDSLGKNSVQKQTLQVSDEAFDHETIARGASPGLVRGASTARSARSSAPTTKPSATAAGSATTADTATTETTMAVPAMSAVKDDDAEWEAVDAEEAVESEYVFI